MPKRMTTTCRLTPERSAARALRLIREAVARLRSWYFWGTW